MKISQVPYRTLRRTKYQDKNILLHIRELQESNLSGNLSKSLNDPHPWKGFGHNPKQHWEITCRAIKILNVLDVLKVPIFKLCNGMNHKKTDYSNYARK